MILDPDYARVFTQARIIAWQQGYACVAHGSYTRDLDLLLVPWEERAWKGTADAMVRMLADACDLRIHCKADGVIDWCDKAHGRRACTLFFPGAADRRWVDLSVMPCIAPPPADPPPA